MEYTTALTDLDLQPQAKTINGKTHNYFCISKEMLKGIYTFTINQNDNMNFDRGDFDGIYFEEIDHQFHIICDITTLTEKPLVLFINKTSKNQVITIDKKLMPISLSDTTDPIFEIRVFSSTKQEALESQNQEKAIVWDTYHVHDMELGLYNLPSHQSISATNALIYIDNQDESGKRNVFYSLFLENSNMFMKAYYIRNFSLYHQKTPDGLKQSLQIDYISSLNHLESQSHKPFNMIFTSDGPCINDAGEKIDMRLESEQTIYTKMSLCDIKADFSLAQKPKTFEITSNLPISFSQFKK